MVHWRFIAPLLLLAMTAGCSGPTGTQSSVRLSQEVGFLHFSDDVGTVEIVRDADAYRVTITTLGSGCAQKGETRIERSGATVAITPYDLHPSGTANCPRVMRSFAHEATVAAEGLRYVVVNARKHPSLADVQLHYAVDVETR